MEVFKGAEFKNSFYFVLTPLCRCFWPVFFVNGKLHAVNNCELDFRKYMPLAVLRSKMAISFKFLK